MKRKRDWCQLWLTEIEPDRKSQLAPVVLDNTRRVTRIGRNAHIIV